MKKRILISILLTLFTASCGFKVLDTSSNNSFSIKDIKTIGEKRINFKIKNKLLLNTSKTQEKIIVVNLNTIKKKSIKEKNIKNEITKYQLVITVNVSYIQTNGGKSDNFVVTKSGDYSASNQYSQILNNEKTLIETLTDGLAEDILNQLVASLNDL
jgi:outer membrane lipopolysaccharide assembly protein LptE/RlpB|tara:strand:- start:106 stop:576 length:471 start_codon:yes stop_codon:yes gene_type:complete